LILHYIGEAGTIHLVYVKTHAADVDMYTL